MSKKVIYGCESRGDGHLPYLTRYTLLSTPWFQLCVHVFHRSDADELHDHPWDFYTMPLWGGYKERYSTSVGSAHATRLRDCKVGRVYYRPAEHAHRVILHNDKGDYVDLIDNMVVEKRAVTLVLMMKRRREWGFYTRTGWQLWTDYFTQKGC